MSYSRRDLSFKWLELFQICANKGSLQAAADETGLSVSTVSHHLKNLEEHLGVDLFDHSRRPMLLTPTGRNFLRKIDGALHAIRTAKAEAASGNIDNASYLRLGLIEDFDADIAPQLAVYLSKQMPQCDFSYLTDSSHLIIGMLRKKELDLGVVAYSSENLFDLHDQPFLRDPFLLIKPKGHAFNGAQLTKDAMTLPFLRFSSSLFISRQIESHLRRLGISLPNHFECANSDMLMAMVAAGAGWSITTALLYSHGKQFQDQVEVHRFPGKSFARTLSIVSTPDCSRSVLIKVRNKFTELLEETAIPMLHEKLPWLQDSFTLIE
ncbi:LysR family transcriptional regulator [Pseudorhodobacter sp. W20_MBD10_FR17]|uniref:LysR family transcriptional regulator n=1 Tax=Pseudorhodobacter sp. W20_MBD10_FR17 TaxID=3240266 RepID=UPI003F9A070F